MRFWRAMSPEWEERECTPRTSDKEKTGLCMYTPSHASLASATFARCLLFRPCMSASHVSTSTCKAWLSYAEGESMAVLAWSD